MRKDTYGLGESVFDTLWFGITRMLITLPLTTLVVALLGIAMFAILAIVFSAVLFVIVLGVFAYPFIALFLIMMMACKTQAGRNAVVQSLKDNLDMQDVQDAYKRKLKASKNG